MYSKDKFICKMPSFVIKTSFLENWLLLGNVKKLKASFTKS